MNDLILSYSEQQENLDYSQALQNRMAALPTILVLQQPLQHILGVHPLLVSVLCPFAVQDLDSSRIFLEKKTKFQLPL